MAKGICPNCEEEIDHLAFASDLTQYCVEYGDCGLDGEDKDHGEVDVKDSSIDDTKYFCPKCDADVLLSEITLTVDESHKYMP